MLFRSTFPHFHDQLLTPMQSCLVFVDTHWYAPFVFDVAFILYQENFIFSEVKVSWSLSEGHLYVTVARIVVYT